VPLKIAPVGSSRSNRAPDLSWRDTESAKDPTVALRTASRAVALAESLRTDVTPRTSPARETHERSDRRPTGDFAQALADGAVEEARTRLERRIRAHLPRGSLSVTLTDNRYTMISVRRDSRREPRYHVRLHHMFSDAGPAITQALARYIASNDRRSSHLLGSFIDDNQHRVRPRTRRPAAARVETRGKNHDLGEIFDDLNARYFGGAIGARITWGQRTSRPRRRNSIKMGSYSVEDRLIRIHRSLDRPFVPRFFIAWIIFHEMLHEVHAIEKVNGRRQFHSPAFLEDEARFEQYVEARAWEREHLDVLLTY
jgi:hypothetical protein